ncbi:hypothetical protein [Sphingomonas panacis]|uniref:hypothetical protein n=1 Tax=Sphingomonas panacis TaxID=1560345 RepID=UPI001F0B68C8|nr:hypothetical protein [Sphingomonas panacis]
MVDADHVVTPEGWRPGDAVLLPPHQDQASLLAEACDPLVSSQHITVAERIER